TGTVQFYDNGNALGSPVSVSGGQAQLATSALTGGAHSITATYSSDTYYVGSTSAGMSVNVAKATATVTLGGLSPTYDGSPKNATATTSASGASTFTFTYDGSATAPTNAGSYSVVATLVNDNYQGT